MTREEAKTVFLNRGYVEVEGGIIYDADKWREACVVISEWLEQEPKTEKVIKMRDATPEEQEYIKSISKPTGVEFDIDINKKVESYGKMLKHPAIKSIMGMDETQEQLDFVQPHKKIPVTLTVSGDLISREAVCDYIAEFINHEYSTQSECEMVDSMIDGIQHMPSIKPQQKTGHWKMPVQDDGMSDPIYYQVRCSKCGFDLDPQTWHVELHQYGADKYCPKCGARMESEQNG